MKSYLFLSAALSLSVLAGEYTVKSEPFETSFSIEARFLPAVVTHLELEPEQWTAFKIKDLVDHGTQVKKGDVLVAFDSEDFEKALFEANESAKSRAITLAITKRELEDLEISTPLALEAAKLKFERTKESFDYFTETGRALEEEQARERLDRAQRSLSYTEEELKQLLKMYEEDGVTEETEEIILKRQRASVKTAQFALKQAELGTSWALEKTIPQKAVDLKAGFESARLTYETAKLNIPRALEQKKIAVAKAIRDAEEADKKLKELEADQDLFSIPAPADGTIYYGKIKDGTWSLGDTSKFLFEKGTVPADSIFMTLVPLEPSLQLHATLNQDQRLKLPSEAKGSASVKGIEDSSYPVEVTDLDLAPRGNGTYRLALKADLPEKSPVIAGMDAKVKLITYKKEEAIVIPKSALTTEDGKSTVKVKMADGKEEAREVKTGKQFNGKVEILEGLSTDQVVLLPDAQ